MPINVDDDSCAVVDATDVVVNYEHVDVIYCHPRVCDTHPCFVNVENFFILFTFDA